MSSGHLAEAETMGGPWGDSKSHEVEAAIAGDAAQAPKAEREGRDIRVSLFLVPQPSLLLLVSKLFPGQGAREPGNCSFLQCSAEQRGNGGGGHTGK